MDALATAVDTLLEDPEASTEVEVATQEEAARAVRLLDQGLRSGRGVHRKVVEGALQGAGTLSTDPLQVLSEFVQNSDDAGAGQLRIVLRSGEILIAHDGAGLRLDDVLPLGMPWLSGKTADAEATGRFGIGLATLRALTTVWEVHCHPFHVRFSGANLEPVAPPALPEEISGPEWTVFRIPLAVGKLTAPQLLEWFNGWNDASLLFLRHVRRLEVQAGEHSTVLALSWDEVTRRRFLIDGAAYPVSVQHARTTDGAVWRVYTAQVTPRSDWKRSHKALGSSMPVSVALPLERGSSGSVHVGLPVAPLDVAARVHTQFDPVANREGFASNRLNAQLVPVITDLWAAGVRDVLERVDASAWHLIPLPASTGSAPSNHLQDRIHAEMLTRARHSLAAELTLPVADGGSCPLADLAVEEDALSGVLDGPEVARLSKTPHALPAAVRDMGGRWREVLADWRAEGDVPLPAEVRVTDALGLFSDHGWQDVARLVRLAAVALETGHERVLADRPCLVTADGRRLRPNPSENAFADTSGEATGPLDVLGVVVDLHPAYAEDSTWAKTVTSWLGRQDCLVRRDDSTAVLKIVSRLGRAGRTLADSDEVTEAARLVALQRALGETPKKLRDRLGPGIGQAVLLSGFAYDSAGTKRPQRVKPGAAYLPQALETADGDRFEVAARKTPGLVWVRRSYAKSLLSAAQAGGLSRTAFLRLLGVADAPRLTPVCQVNSRADTKSYPGDARLGLAQECRWAVAGRRMEMSDAGADHTLDDLTSADLFAVVRNIAAEKDVEERRRRTAALLRTLAVPLTSSDQAMVAMAKGHYKWNVTGETAAIWVWQLRKMSWLEDSRGRLRPPTKLTLRTPDTEALYGPEDPGYLHPAIHQALITRTEVLTALGVCGDPDVPQLMERLHELRSRGADVADQVDAGVPDSLKAEALLVYQSLVRRLTHRSADAPQAAVERQVRSEFLYQDLVLTDQGWMRSGQCFQGPAILRGFRPFALTGADVAPLWQVLGIPEPGLDDLIDVLKDISGAGTAPDAEREWVMLEALRRLRDMISSDRAPLSPGLQSRLRNLPLWTTAGWVKGRGRMAFAVADSRVERLLTDRLPLWRPGGNVQQFAALFGWLHVTPLDVAGAQVTYESRDVDDAGSSALDQPFDTSLTEDFRRGVAALQDLLVRDEPEMAESFTGWAWLTGLDVRLLPGLRIRLEPGDVYEPIELPVDAQIDRGRNTLFLNSPTALTTKAGAGAAIAVHFAAERSRVGHSWRDVWEEHLVEAAAGAALTSAGHREREERQRLAEELCRRSQLPPVVPMAHGRTAARRGTSTGSAVPAGPIVTVPPPRDEAGRRADPQNASVARPLVDAAAFDALPGQVTHTGTPSAPDTTPSTPARTTGPASRPHGTPLPQPRPGGAPPRSRPAPLEYTDHEKEELVIHALRRVLRERGIELYDQRGASGVGADLDDSTGRFYEIKAHGNDVPGELTLTRSEFVRAWSEGENYTLVIASHLKDGAGNPTLRLVNDPVHRFEVEPTSDVRLKGVRDMSVESTVYEWPSRE
ncbi:hypothetical protein ABZ726_12550 [Streptomyces hundungensis]|uniref:sacsin N-terminal ATP-binding-like domain-containing protein n=1 Tax=Streptomyces hundungensis TaxID=1077946 RepID=UPI0033F76854